MLKSRIPAKLWELIRTYVVMIALITALGYAFVEVWTVGTGPVPQQPLDGLLIEKATVELGWKKGTRSGDLTLQVSIDDPNFGELTVEKKSAGSAYTLNELEPGRTYYWRLVQNGAPSPTAFFKTSTNAVQF